MRTIRIAPVVLILLAPTTPLVWGDVLTFTGEQNSRWAVAANWVPIEQAPPGPGDKAIIPNGKSCLVDSDEAAEVVEIAGGATLTIAGKTLTTQDDGVAGQVGGIKVDGTLRFERAAGVRGVLRYAGTGDPSNFAITGGGTLIAEGSTHAGRIENLSIGGTETLTIGDEPTP